MSQSVVNPIVQCSLTTQAKSEGKKLKKVALRVSCKGIHMVDIITKEVLCDLSIYRCVLLGGDGVGLWGEVYATLHVVRGLYHRVGEVVGGVYNTTLCVVGGLWL